MCTTEKMDLRPGKYFSFDVIDIPNSRLQFDKQLASLVFCEFIILYDKIIDKLSISNENTYSMYKCFSV